VADDLYSTDALTYGGDFSAAERVCAAGLARSRDVGDLSTEARLLHQMAMLDLQARRTEDAAVHLQEGLPVALQTGGGIALLNGLDCCGHLCAATRRFAEAITVWAADAAFFGTRGSRRCPSTCAAGRNRCARPGKRSETPGPGPLKPVARR
jgi:hypothetical protein